MRKILLTVLLSLALLLSSCVGTASEVKVPQPKAGDDVIVITVKDNGISAESIVVVKNFYSGARAEAVYQIYNASSKAIIPEIFINKDADIANYSKADGAIKAPEYVNDWIELPAVVTIQPNETRDFIVALQMPEGAEKPADKIGFQIGVASRTKEMFQPAVGIWWLVNMR